MNWPEAVRLQSPIRRVGWLKKWVYQMNGIWWVDETPARVVTALDVTAEDLRSGDWTNLTVDGVVVSPTVPSPRMQILPTAMGTPQSG